MENTWLQLLLFDFKHDTLWSQMSQFAIYSDSDWKILCHIIQMFLLSDERHYIVGLEFTCGCAKILADFESWVDGVVFEMPLSECSCLSRNTQTSLLPDTFWSSSRCGRCWECGVVPRPGSLCRELSLLLGLLPIGHTLTILRTWPGGVQVSRWHQ